MEGNKNKTSKFKLVQTAFKSRLQTYTAIDICKGDLKTVLNTYVGDIEDALNSINWSLLNILNEKRCNENVWNSRSRG